jgi:hypothetical protein
MKLEFQASDILIDVAKDVRGNFVPTVSGATGGSLQLEIARNELQSMLLAFARAAAAEQGAKVESIELTLTTLGERSVQAAIRVKARKSFIPATVNVTGRMDVDDKLNATFSAISSTGDGMIGSVVAKVLDSKLQPFNGRTLPLADQYLQNIRLQSLKLEVGDPLRISATFAS